jgi:hypothetical protein
MKLKAELKGSTTADQRHWQTRFASKSWTIEHTLLSGGRDGHGPATVS